MTEKRFGSLDTFVEVGDWTYRMGRPVANEGFLTALLTHGTFDTYEFFCPDLHHMDAFMQRVEELVPDSTCLARVRPSLQIALPESLQTTEYFAFHMGDFTYAMPRLVALRNRLAPEPFPVTGITHSLDAVGMTLRYLELALSGLGPWDGVVCTSRAAEKAVRKGFEWVREQGGIGLIGNTPRDVPTLERIPLGIDDVFFDKGDRAAARDYLRIPEDTVVGLSVGRFSLRQKADWSPVLEQLARMAAAGKLERFLLLIAGGAEPAEVNMLESLISRTGLKDRVMLFPNFPAETKTTLYQAADFYVSLVDNYQETFGLNIVEALASGLPVICSDFSGYRELVESEETGLLIPTTAPAQLPGFLKDGLAILDPSVAGLYRAQTVALDLQHLERAMVSLIENGPLRKRMSEHARQSAGAFQWAAIIPEYEAFWRRLSDKARSNPSSPISQGAGLLLGDMDALFSHYPSRLLHDDRILELTDAGRGRTPGEVGLVRYEDVAVCLFPELESLILEILEHRNRTVRDIQEIAGERLEASPGQTLFHILWLMKHGILAGAPVQQEPS